MKKSTELKEFLLSTWAINHSTVVSVIIGLFLFLGIYSFFTLPRENFPDIQETEIYVSSVYPGNTAEDIERLITDPLEESLKTVQNVKEISSSSIEDFSIITVQFDENITVGLAKQKIQEEIDEVISDPDWPTFNSSKVQPNAFEFIYSEELPIVNVSLMGDFPLDKLKFYAEELKDAIEELPEIIKVDMRGVEDFEVEVSLDIFKMNASKVSFNNIVNSLNRENKTISAGNILGDGQRRNIRIIGEISKPSDLEKFVVKTQNGSVYLGDIAEINFKEKEKTSFARSFGETAVMLDVKKRAGKNLIEAVKKIRKIVDDYKGNKFPTNLEVSISNDQSNETTNLVNDLTNNIIFGVILVVTVLMFFLGFRNALFVGFAIPMSMFMSFMILGFLGYTINRMTLFGLIMGLGMLVDNGIVVVENAYRLMQKKGFTKIEAAKKSVGEIAFPIIISTITTIAAFVPLAFWPGIIGKFMVFFPLTLSIVLGSSLIVAIFFNSMLVSKFMKIEDNELTTRSLWKMTLLLGGLGLILIFNVGIFRGIGTLMILICLLFWSYKFFIKNWARFFQKNLIPSLEKKYKSLISFVLTKKNPIYFLFGTISLLFSSFIILGLKSPKVEFFPSNEPAQIIIYLEYPEGTSIKKTNSTALNFEKEINSVLNQDKYLLNNKNFMIKSYVTQVGTGSQNPQSDKGAVNEMPNKAKITLNMSEFKDRNGFSSEDLRGEIQQRVNKKFPGLLISVEKDAKGPPVGYPINIEVSGRNYGEIIEVASSMRTFLDSKKISGIEELKIDVNKNKPGIEIFVDRKKTGELGVSAGQVGNQLRRSLFGEKTGIYKHEGEDYDINIRLDKKDRYNIETLLNQYIIFRDEGTGKIKEIPISSLVETKNTVTFNNIKHKNLKRVVTLYSSVLGGYNENEVIQKTMDALNDFNLPEGIDYKFGGQIEEQEENFNFLKNALGFALFLIVLILVFQFNSISNPLIILLSIFLSFTGVLLGISIFNMPFVILMTMMGIISLAGIVVNNSVVLIDYTQLLIARKKSELEIPFTERLPRLDVRQAIIEGGVARLRPVILTAITTILGLLPLATGFNIDFYSLFTSWNPNIYFGGDNFHFWGPLAWTVIFGLSFATFLTLIIIPSSFYLVYQIKLKVFKSKKT